MFNHRFKIAIYHHEQVYIELIWEEGNLKSDQICFYPPPRRYQFQTTKKCRPHSNSRKYSSNVLKLIYVILNYFTLNAKNPHRLIKRVNSKSFVVNPAQSFIIKFDVSLHQKSFLKQFHQRPSSSALTIRRREVPGSTPSRISPPRRSEFSVVFSETLQIRGRIPQKDPHIGHEVPSLGPTCG